MPNLIYSFTKLTKIIENSSAKQPNTTYLKKQNNPRSFDLAC